MKDYEQEFLDLYDSTSDEDHNNEEFVKNIVDNYTFLDKCIYEKIDESRRWVTLKIKIFKFKDRYFLLDYSIGNTEYQDNGYYSIEEIILDYTPISVLNLSFINKSTKNTIFTTLVYDKLC